jgi:hypothetical protein
MANWAWPEIIDEDSARDAAHMAGGWAGIVAGLTALFAVISIVGGVSVMGAGPLSLVDAALFAVVGWQTWRGSRAFAVAGLSLYGLEICFGIVSHRSGVGVLTFVILLAFVNGVRGTFGMNKYKGTSHQQALSANSFTFQGAMPATSAAPPPPDSPK